eukprot:s135_g15.t1
MKQSRHQQLKLEHGGHGLRFWPCRTGRSPLCNLVAATVPYRASLSNLNPGQPRERLVGLSSVAGRQLRAPSHRWNRWKNLGTG